MKEYISGKENYTVEDLGCHTYYDAAAKVGTKVKESKEDTSDRQSLGLLVCGTGMGVGMIANKVPGIRAATVENVTAARYARAVNDANVLCLGQLITNEATAKEIVDAFLEQEFRKHPIGPDGKPADWWSKDVENFLSTSLEGISRVEQETQKTQQ